MRREAGEEGRERYRLRSKRIRGERDVESGGGKEERR